MRLAGVLAAAVMLLACGADEQAPGEPDSVRMLTIFAPQYGATVGPKVVLEVAQTGADPGVEYQIGVLVDGDLVATTPDPTIEIDLAEGVRRIEVIGVDAEGNRLRQIAGDDIWLRVDPSVLESDEI